MNIKEKNFISVVIYIHNDECNIEKFLKMIIDNMELYFENSEIICVNDNSTDNSVEIIRKVSKSAKNTSVSLLNMSYYHGIEKSMSAGVDLVIGDFVFEFDSANMDFDEKEIMNAYYKTLEGYDIVSVSSQKRGRSSSMLFYKIFNKFSGIPHKLHTERFRILSRRAINRIMSMDKTIIYRKAAYASCGLQMYDIKYIPNKNLNINTKQEKKYREKLAMDTLVIFTDFGFKFSMLMTSLMALTTVLMAIYCICVYITSNPVEGWTTTILFLSFSFLGLFGILSVIIKYLQILVQLTFKRIQYSYESIEKLTK